MSSKKTALEETLDFLEEINVEGYGNTRLIEQARREFRALMRAVRWLDKQARLTYSEPTEPVLAPLRRLGILPPVRK